MTIVIGVIGCIILFIIGLALLIPGIIGTAVTGKAKIGTKAIRVLSIIAMVLGIILCVIPLGILLVSSIL